jgi:hypothetical protein
MERRYIGSAAQMVPVSAYASVALEECRRSADFMTGPKSYSRTKKILGPLFPYLVSSLCM